MLLVIVPNKLRYLLRYVFLRLALPGLAGSSTY